MDEGLVRRATTGSTPNEELNGRERQKRVIEQLVLDLGNRGIREDALRELSKVFIQVSLVYIIKSFVMCYKLALWFDSIKLLTFLNLRVLISHVISLSWLIFVVITLSFLLWRVNNYALELASKFWKRKNMVYSLILQVNCGCMSIIVSVLIVGLLILLLWDHCLTKSRFEIDLFWWYFCYFPWLPAYC